MSITKKLSKRGLISPPKFVSGSIQYEALTGSESYGVSSGNSDRDIVGFCIPPKSTVFPHLAGEIQGFGTQIKRFNQYQKHHTNDPEAMNGKGCVWDISVYNIVKFFHLAMENNPNIIDVLFVPDRCILSITKIGQMVRDARHMFLHKGLWFRYKGYAYSQMKKMKVKKPKPESKRYESVMKYGYDLKFAYHIIRLLDECSQALTTGDIDLQQNREQLKSIRRGDWSIEDIEKHFEIKERELETLYHESKLPYGPPEDKIKELLLNCLEEFYGSLENAILLPDFERRALKDIDKILDGVRNRI